MGVSARLGAEGVRLLVVTALLTPGCAPLTVTVQSKQDAYLRLNRNVLSDGGLSETTLTTLRRHDLAASYEDYPDETIAALRSQVVGRPEAWSELFALSELSYQAAEREHSQAQFLAAAVYAYTFLFPENGADAPNPYDPRFRQACDLYNLSLAAAMVPTEGGEAVLKAGRYALPFGTLDLEIDEASLSWGGRRLTGIVPTGALKVEGLVNQYHTPGIGAPMAARGSPPAQTLRGFQVAPHLRVPTTLLMSIPSPRAQLARGTVRATLSVHNIFDSGYVTLGPQRVPLEYDQTAARALSIVENRPWSTEYAGFLQGTLLDRSETRLVAIQPHRQGRRPVVLVHGTASSAFRWADMINDLLEDPRISNNFEFWSFSYATGNPIPDSARILHESLAQAIRDLGGTAADPALGHITLIGHSQGGLLVKMQVIDPGDALWNAFSRRPLDQLRLTDKTRELLRQALFPAPVPEVDRVIFIATPHQGSFVAAFSVSHLVGRLVTLPLSVTKAGAELLTGNADALRLDPTSTRLGSVYGMTPGSPLIKGLAPIPIVPNVHVHSIIPVATDGPVAEGDDGVVKYASAHLDNAESEKVVRSGHSTQSNPLTIEEVHRILLLSLAAQCGSMDCAQPRVAQQ